MTKLIDAFSPAFKVSAALARVDGNRELLGPMGGVFALQWRTLSDEIVQATRQRDGRRLERTAHRLKESAASFGADQICEIARDLQAHGRDGDFHGVEEICVRLITAIDRLVNGLKQFAAAGF